MNLVCKEFVASRTDRNGVLILSEMAGAAKELNDALLINPNDNTEIADTTHRALEMDIEEQVLRMTSMHERISQYDVNAWAADFFDQLYDVKKMQKAFEVRLIDNFIKANLLAAFAAAGRRLLLLDYDGTLMPFAKTPQLAIPSKELLALLLELAAGDRNDVYVISGRDSATLESWLGQVPIGLIAEHGASVKLRGSDWTNESTIVFTNNSEGIERIMKKYVTKCPQSFIKKKEFSLAWHYRNAEPFQSKLRAKALCDELIAYVAPYPLHVLRGHKVVEVRSSEIDKGKAVKKLLEKHSYDFILCMGDDQTDEDMFNLLNGFSNAYTVKIGAQPSFARYNLLSPYQVQSLLQSLIGYEKSKYSHSL